MCALAGKRPLPESLPSLGLTSARMNHLLGALPETDFDSIARHLQPVTLRLGDSIYEPGGPQHYAIFPTTAIVSLHYVTATGASAETAAIGKEGMVGMALFLGGDTTPSSARVLVSGSAFRIPAGELRKIVDVVGPLRDVLLHYVPSLFAQFTLMAVCNRHHVIEQQFCRWLLCLLDRMPQNDLVMTQELVAQALGVRRESITEVATRLRESGVIRCRRGHISVLDRVGLEHRACTCYAAAKKEQARLLAPVPRRRS